MEGSIPTWDPASPLSHPTCPSCAPSGSLPVSVRREHEGSLLVSVRHKHEAHLLSAP